MSNHVGCLDLSSLSQRSLPMIFLLLSRRKKPMLKHSNLTIQLSRNM